MGKLTNSVAIVTGALAVFAVPGFATAVQAAEPNATSLVLPKNADVQTGGSGLVLGLDVSCDAASDFAFLDLRVTQIGRDGSPVTTYYTTNIDCKGRVDRLVVGLTPSGGESEEGAPFEPGSAFVSGTVASCTEFECSSADATQSVRLRERTINRATFTDSALTLALPKTGTIEAAGAGATVKIGYTCQAGVVGSFFGTLAQRAGDAVALGYDGMEITCDQIHRSGILAFHATTAAWKAGAAFLTLEGEACDAGYTCAHHPHTFRTLTLG
jgi:hypothetical protein